MGAGARGQAFAALFCATLPNGILQASGAKNDYLLACWLVLMVYCALRRPIAVGVALGLALFTKPTAYLFAPPLLAAAWRPKLGRAIPLAATCVLAINGPQYWRNFQLSGSPLGFDSAHGDGHFRWRNEAIGLRPTISTVLRHLSDQLGVRSERWNRGVYDLVLRAHGWLGADPNDPRTTWPGAKFEPPRNTNHEANASNRWHLLLLVAATPALARRRHRRWLWYFLAVAAGFLAFAAYLKWQPFLARLELPLFVAASPLAGLLGERIRPAALQLVLCLFLLNNSRPYLFENWTRRLQGPGNLFAISREDAYFNDMTWWNNRQDYLAAVRLTLDSGCTDIGIDITRNELEYPYQALLRRSKPSIRFRHTGMGDAPQPPPCAVLCLDCAQRADRIALYRTVGEPLQFGHFLLFLPARDRL
jgi:hypothetical protein